jgi:hypothetical protein
LFSQTLFLAVKQSSFNFLHFDRAVKSAATVCTHFLTLNARVF